MANFESDFVGRKMLSFFKIYLRAIQKVHHSKIGNFPPSPLSQLVIFRLEHLPPCHNQTCDKLKCRWANFATKFRSHISQYTCAYFYKILWMDNYAANSIKWRYFKSKVDTNTISEIIFSWKGDFTFCTLWLISPLCIQYLTLKSFWLILLPLKT